MIETLPSGSLRVRIKAGIDPVTKKEHHLTEVVPAGPDAAVEAEKVRTKLLNQLDERRASKTRATVNQLLDKHFELLKVEPKTIEGYESVTRNHIRPLLGEQQLGKIDGHILDSFYSVLRTCRAYCGGRKFVEHRKQGEHQCTDKCRPHVCKGLGDGSLRKIQAVLSGAGKRAKRWGWIGVNSFDLAEPLPGAPSNPQPPSVEQAARIATEAWRDLDWGMLGEGDQVVSAAPHPARRAHGCVAALLPRALRGARRAESHAGCRTALLAQAGRQYVAQA
ncbi:N-terminal phage integrase SAM-like domain-containing protein [Amycolatopsis balhimycina]|uniref:N-terminal phage integrase SAM-like domain-containing protein n=1 Tax=Amycolatopsis balhimycina TaxID=208443 RepID=UPI00039DA0F4|nr:N-terminal phage integrase SAM-like domain-containing protein [Amycolatopsis balhimycina]